MVYNSKCQGLMWSYLYIDISHNLLSGKQRVGSMLILVYDQLCSSLFCRQTIFMYNLMCVCGQLIHVNCIHTTGITSLSEYIMIY